MSVANAGPIAAADSLRAEEQKVFNAGTDKGLGRHDDSVSSSSIVNEAGLEAHDPIPAPTAVVAPDQFDPKYETKRPELWSYYTYYIGNNGLTLFNFAPTAFQSLLSTAAGDAEVLHFLGRDRNIESIVLLANGISFAIQVALFLILGSYADYGTWRPSILMFWSAVAFGLGFGWLGVQTADKWQIATGFYMVGLIAYQMCLTFWTAAFPGLARNTAEMRERAEQYEAGKIDRSDYDFTDMMVRNRISNVAFIIQSAGEIIILAILIGILFAVNVTASPENNQRGLSVLIAYGTGVWLVLAIPWFVFEKRRPGQKVPAGMNVVSVGLWTLWRAMKAIWQLRTSFLYLVGYFFLGDSLNTTVTVIATLQNSVVAYDTLTLTYLIVVGIVAQLIGIVVFWLVQKRFGLSTKFMFNIVVVGILVLDLWGMVGIFTSRFGFKHVWELWLYQIYYGLFVCPWYSYSQTMISEVTPRGKEFLFFSLFSIMGKTSAFVGPIVSSAIIDADGARPGRGGNGNVSLPFYFLVGLTALSLLVLIFGVDLERSRREQTAFLAEERAERVRRRSSVAAAATAAVSPLK